MEQILRWEMAFLAEPPVRIFTGDGLLTQNHSEWMQDPRIWMIIYYHHMNAVTLGTRTYAVGPGDLAFFSPGQVGGHERVGPSTHFDFLSFELPAVAGVRAAIPHVVRGMSAHLPQLRNASSRIVDTVAPVRAYIWNLFWTVAQSPSRFRENEALYVAEDFIRRNLGVKFVIGEIAEAAEVSPRTLLKLFRAEHGVTLQEYILRKRVQEASRLLLTSQHSIKDVAARVGMADLQYFNKTMRAMTGMPPSKLRQSDRPGLIASSQ